MDPGQGFRLPRCVSNITVGVINQPLSSGENTPLVEHIEKIKENFPSNHPDGVIAVTGVVVVCLFSVNYVQYLLIFILVAAHCNSLTYAI